MKRFEVVTDNDIITVDLPNKVEEVSNEYLTNVTQEVKVADNYSLVGVYTIEKLSVVLSAIKAPKSDARSVVVPVFIKAGKTDNEFISSMTTGNKLIISGGDLSMGYHVTAPGNELNMNKVIDVLSKGKLPIFKENDYYCFLSFKIVPNCAIHGYYGDDICTKENAFIRATGAAKDSNNN